MDIQDFMASIGAIRMPDKQEIPEHCPWCGNEFVWDIQPTTPPSMSTSCECGQWIVVVPDDESKP